MGQAKVRSEEIKAIKAKNEFNNVNVGEEINLIAIKHCANGWKHTVKLNMSITGGERSRDQLLKEICTQDWVKNSIHQKIVNYTAMTSTYQTCKMLGGYGLVVNFYEHDDEYHGAYSCREIIVVRSQDIFEKIIDEAAREAVEAVFF